MMKYMSGSKSEIENTQSTTHVCGEDVGIFIPLLPSFFSKTNNILCCLHSPKTIKPIGTVCPLCSELQNYKYETTRAVLESKIRTAQNHVFCKALNIVLILLHFSYWKTTRSGTCFLPVCFSKNT
jgi:hypothetical protein